MIPTPVDKRRQERQKHIYPVAFEENSTSSVCESYSGATVDDIVCSIDIGQESCE